MAVHLYRLGLSRSWDTESLNLAVFALGAINGILQLGAHHIFTVFICMSYYVLCSRPTEGRIL